MTPTKPAEPTKKRSPFDSAASLCKRLDKLDAAERQELEQSPAEIKARYAGRRQTLLSEADPEVRELANQWLALKA